MYAGSLGCHCAAVGRTGRRALRAGPDKTQQFWGDVRDHLNPAAKEQLAKALVKGAQPTGGVPVPMEPEPVHNLQKCKSMCPRYEKEEHPDTADPAGADRSCMRTCMKRWAKACSARAAC